MLHEVDIKTAVDAMAAGKKVLAMMDLKGEYDVTSLQKYLEDAHFLVDEQEVGLPVDEQQVMQPLPRPWEKDEQPAADQEEVKPERKPGKRDAIRARLPEIKEMLANGMSQRYIAKQLGFDQAELSKVLAENGVTVKKKIAQPVSTEGLTKKQTESETATAHTS